MTDQRNKLLWQSLEVLSNQHWISSSLQGRGDLEFSGNLRFSGSWRGSIRSLAAESHLYIRPEARLTGIIKVEKISVEGCLEDIDVEADWFHALPGARISGRVKAKNLIIDSGAIIEGRIVSQSTGKLKPKELGTNPE